MDEMGFVRLGARFEPTTAEIGFVAAAPGDVAGATARYLGVQIQGLAVGG